MREARVVIRVEELTGGEKDQIVYNHMRLGGQPIPFKSDIKRFLPLVGQVPKFLPEIARRLANPYFTRNLYVTRDGVSLFVEQPVDLLFDILSNLGKNELAALALIFMRGGSVKSPVDIASEEEESLLRIGGEMAGVVAALQAMEDSMVRLHAGVAGREWMFRHPTIRDAMAGFTASQPELLDVYLQGVTTERLLKEVVCGPANVVGARVVVPETRYGDVLERFEGLEPNRVDFFLSQRADRVFLDLYARRFGWQSRWSTPESDSLTFQPAVRVIAKLNAVGLLPEAERRVFVKAAREVAVGIPDASVLQMPDVRAIFLPEELDELVLGFETAIDAKLQDWIEDYKDSYSTAYDPYEHYDPLLNVLTQFKGELQRLGRDNATVEVSGAVGEIHKLIERAEIRREEDDSPEWVVAEPVTALVTDQPRSIFDDVDSP
jgi:hypothetical protein